MYRTKQHWRPVGTASTWWATRLWLSMWRRHCNRLYGRSFIRCAAEET